MSQYDALLIVSFGGPEGMDEVMPFLENVLRGRNVPRERLLDVAHHYELFGGISPINAQNRALIAALRTEFATHDLNMPIYWGNRNWQPFLADALRQMANDGRQHALAFFTSAYSSYSGCRQYREDIMRAQAEVGPDAPQVDKLRMFYNHPGFIEANVDRLRTALQQIPAARRDQVPIAFTAHSIPLTMAKNSRYEMQLHETCRLISDCAGISADRWQLVYQSRSGSPRQPWLSPDILQHLQILQAQNAEDVVVMPVGFISDHIEVLYDLDTEAKQMAAELGINMIRVPTVGTHPAFVSLIRALIEERMNADNAADHGLRAAIGRFGPDHDVCPVDCCLAG